jgi:hypothetical protein
MRTVASTLTVGRSSIVGWTKFYELVVDGVCANLHTPRPPMVGRGTRLMLYGPVSA